MWRLRTSTTLSTLGSSPFHCMIPDHDRFSYSMWTVTPGTSFDGSTFVSLPTSPTGNLSPAVYAPPKPGGHELATSPRPCLKFLSFISAPSYSSSWEGSQGTQ